MINDQNSPVEFTRGQAWYDLIAAVDPNDPDRVFIGGVDPLVSDDVGATWTQIAQWHTCCTALQVVHADHHEILFLPGDSDVMYWGNDGGFYTSQDGSANPPTISFRSNNLNLTQFYSCDINPNPGSNIYIGGTQDNGTQRFTNAGLSTTAEVVGGDGGFSHIDYDETNIEISSTTFSRYRITNNNWGATTAVTFPTLGNGNGFFH